MAHPGKLTPERQDKLVAAIKEGHFYETACATCGISYQTFRNWMQLGEQATSGRYFEFFEAITHAEAEAENHAVRLWQAAMETDWRAAQMFLERRHPDRWGKRDRLALDQQVQAKVEVDHAINTRDANALLAVLGYGPLGSTDPGDPSDPTATTD